MVATSSADNMSRMSKLTLKTPSATAKNVAGAPKQKRHAIADSWDDQDVDSDPESLEELSTLSVADSQAGTQAPPPTPISPAPNSDRLDSPPSPGAMSRHYDYGEHTARFEGNVRRPEKTDAVARRMIAGALGLRAPKLTEEQKAYDKAIKENERKRRDQEREKQKQREEEAAKAKQAVWED